MYTVVVSSFDRMTGSTCLSRFGSLNDEDLGADLQGIRKPQECGRSPIAGLKCRQKLRNVFHFIFDRVWFALL